MQKLKSNIQNLVNECNSLETHLDGTGVMMAFDQSIKIGRLEAFPKIRSAIKEISEFRNSSPLYIMVNTILPECSVPRHTDTLKDHSKLGKAPKHERWHLPVQTNPDAIWWDEVESHLVMELGFWYGPVPYWLVHSVCNLGKEPRIHLIIDLEKEYEPPTVDNAGTG